MAAKLSKNARDGSQTSRFPWFSCLDFDSFNICFWMCSLHDSEFKGPKVILNVPPILTPLFIVINLLWSQLLASLPGNGPRVSGKYTHLLSVTACIITFLVAVTKYPIKTTWGRKWLFWLTVQRDTAYCCREETWSGLPGLSSQSPLSIFVESEILHSLWDDSAHSEWLIPPQLKLLKLSQTYHRTCVHQGCPRSN